MTCPDCGATTHPDDNFCLRCGRPLTPASETSRTATAPVYVAAAGPPPLTPPGRSEYVYGGPTAGPFTGSAVPPPVLPPAAYPPPAAPAWPPSYLPPGQGGRRTTLAAAAIGGGILLLLIGALAVWWVYRAPQGRAGLPPAQVGAVVPTPAAGGYSPQTADERAVIAAIADNNNAQIAALRHVDAHALDGHMAGKALADNQGMVQQMQQQGVYEDARLVHIEYGQPRFLGTDQASIRTVEQWESTTYRRSDGQTVSTQPVQTLHEIYYLTRQNGSWIVQQVDIQEDQQATPGPGT